MAVIQRIQAAGPDIKCINHKPTDESYVTFTNESVHTFKESCTNLNKQVDLSLCFSSIANKKSFFMTWHNDILLVDIAYHS